MDQVEDLSDVDREAFLALADEHPARCGAAGMPMREMYLFA